MGDFFHLKGVILLFKDSATGIDKLSISSGVGINDRINWRPKWTIEKYDKNMRLYETEEIDGNLMLNEGISELLKLLIGDGTAVAFNSQNAYIGVGDGTTAASATQTGLVGVNKTYAPMDATYPQVNGPTVTFRSTFGPSAGNHNWREFTVANSNSDAGKNLNRKVESALRTKVSPDTWIVQLSITMS